MGQIGLRWEESGTLKKNPNSEHSSRRAKIYTTEIGFEVPEYVLFEANMTHFGAKSETPHIPTVQKDTYSL